MPSQPLHILGAGSMGLLWAAVLKKSNHQYPLRLLLRRPRNQEQQAMSVERLIHWNQKTSSSLETKMSSHMAFQAEYITTHTEENAPTEAIKTLLVTTKAYQAEQAIQNVQHRFTTPSEDPTRVILLCNGALSVRDEWLQKQASLDRRDHSNSKNMKIILATTTHGAYQNENNTVLVHAGVGETFLEDAAEDLAADWNKATNGLLHCHSLSSPHMETLLWKKLAANCVINPLTAIYGCTNGELWMEPSFPSLQEEVLKEIETVANATSEEKTMPSSNLSQAPHPSRLSLDELSDFVRDVIRDTTDNKSSMLQDVLQKKRTEIDHLNGYVVRKGRMAGIDCPANEDLVQRIVELGKSSSQV